MPTQEERLLALEQTQTKFGEAISDLNQYVTIMTGIMSRQEWDIREIKTNLRSIDGRLNSFENRFSSLESRFGSFEGRFSSLEGRFEAQEHRIENFEQSVNNRVEAQDKKLDQILLLLTTLTPKSDQEA